MQLGNLQNQKTTNNTVEGRFVIVSDTSYGVVNDGIKNFYNTSIDGVGKIFSYIPFVGDDIQSATNILKSANKRAQMDFEQTRATISMYDAITLSPNQIESLNNFILIKISKNRT